MFDFNGDGKVGLFETMAAMKIFEEVTRDSLEDSFDADVCDELEMAGLDYDELELMDEDERREALEDAGLDPDDFEDDF